MPQNYAVALTHVALGGVGIFCFQRSYSGGTVLRLPLGTYSVIVANSLIGIYRWGLDQGDDVDRPYEFTKLLRMLFAMPCIAGQIWINAGFQKELGYVHPALSLIPLAAYFSDNHRGDVADFLIACNVVSCGVISFLAENNMGIIVAFIYGINHFMICDKEDFNDIPNPAICNLVLCAFTYLAHKSLGGSNVWMQVACIVLCRING